MEYNSSLPIYLQVANLIKRDIVTKVPMPRLVKQTPSVSSSLYTRLTVFGLMV